MRLAIKLALLSGTNVVLIIAAQWYIITRLGVDAKTDALFAAMSVPQVVLAVVSTSLSHVLVPLLATHRDPADDSLAWTFFFGCALVFSAFGLLLAAAAQSWVPLVVPGFSRAQQELTVSLTRIQLLGMVCTACTGVLWAVLHAQQRFVWTELSQLCANAVCCIALVLMMPIWGVSGAAWALVLRAALQVAWLLPSLGRPQRPRFQQPAVREAWRRVKPLLLGTIYYKNEPIVDRYLASLAPSGAISVLYIAQQLYSVAANVANKAVAVPMIPSLARAAVASDWHRFRNDYRRRLIAMVGLALAAWIAFVLVGQQMLVLAIGHGGVTTENVHQLWLVMVALIGFALGSASGQVLSTAFYAYGDTKTPTWIGTAGFTVGIGLKIIGFIHFGLIGIALATSASSLLNSVLMWWLLDRSSRSFAAV